MGLILMNIKMIKSECWDNSFEKWKEKDRNEYLIFIIFYNNNQIQRNESE